MHRQLPSAAFLLLLIAVPLAADARFCATGPIKGQECTGIGIEVCNMIRVDAVEGEGGRLYTVSECYDEVSDYNARKGRCWITTKSRGLGLFAWIMNAASQPAFYHKNDAGEYKELDVEYLTFPCERR